MKRAWVWFQKHVLGRSDVNINGQLYMRRWLIGPKSWYGIRIHHIVKSDVGPLHDHPFDFVSFILWGGYGEELPNRYEWHEPFTLVRHKAEDLHLIKLLQYPALPGTERMEGAAWTLVFRGPYRRDWGFYIAPGEGWVDWRTYVKRANRHRPVGEFVAASST